MKKSIILAMGAAVVMLGATACKGRTQENMTPDSDTVEVGAEVVMNNASDSDTTVIADSPAEAQAQAEQQAAAKQDEVRQQADKPLGDSAK